MPKGMSTYEGTYVMLTANLEVIPRDGKYDIVNSEEDEVIATCNDFRVAADVIRALVSRETLRLISEL